MTPSPHLTFNNRNDQDAYNYRQLKRKDWSLSSTQGHFYSSFLAIQAINALVTSLPPPYNSTLLLRVQYEGKCSSHLEIFDSEYTPSFTHDASRVPAPPVTPQCLFQAAIRPRTSSRLVKQRAPYRPSSTLHIDEPSLRREASYAWCFHKKKPTYWPKYGTATKSDDTTYGRFQEAGLSGNSRFADSKDLCKGSVQSLHGFFRRHAKGGNADFRDSIDYSPVAMVLWYGRHWNIFK